jgi:uncharacterized Zn finger protein (UPF0148 family)
MPFCPRCRYEYKDGIGECPDCGIRLVEELEEEDSEEESAEGEEGEAIQKTDFVPLRHYNSRSSIEIIQEALEKEGITAIVINRDDIIRVTDTNYPVSKLIIWVQDKDFEKAQEIADHAFDEFRKP